MPAAAKPAVFQNEMIRASAGSGKTFQLTNRFIGLMAHGVEPERIIALTFTRKAAGEFFDAILEKLAKAAIDPTFCKELADSPYIPALEPTDFLQLLRKLVSRIHLLSLGTLDSFFSSILRNFPFEFGLGGGFEILDDHLAATEQLRVYRQVFQRPTPGQPHKEQEAFLEAFKLATFGREESKLIRQLSGFIKSNHEIYLAAPSSAKWGNPHTIWPNGWQWGNQSGQLNQFLKPLLTSLENSGISEKQLHRWKVFADSTCTHNPGTPMPKTLTYVFKKLLENYQELQAGNANIVIERRPQELNAMQCQHLLEITHRLVNAEIENHLSRTRGIHSIINEYEKTYGRLVRRRGKLTFADLLIILTNREASSPLLSQTPDEDSRLQIDFRLDGRFDHWLLDEFQDTNYLQWLAMENLIDETVQDTSGQRTLFQVGDVKQAIYGWRGGDVRLFDEIQRRYRDENGAPRINERRLDTSYRSGPDIIGMVNQVFSDAPALSLICPPTTLARWTNEWSDHVSSRPNLHGYACLLNPNPGDGKEKADKDDIFSTLLAILEHIRPDQRGINCAILVQGNKLAAEIVDHVRGHSNIPIYSETDTHIAADNPLCLAILALFEFASHPGDTFAWQHLQMTPFGHIMHAEALDPSSVCNEILTDLNHHGTEFVINRWLDRLKQNQVPLDPFSIGRASEFTKAAQTFDQTGSRNLNEFISYAQNYTVREPAADGTVQVMTIHKSKGLGFDLVLLPDLAGESLAQSRDGISVEHADDRSVDWVLDLPSKDITRLDKVLSQHLEQQEGDNCYESLCKFYVAMTRAKQAMYLIALPHGNSKSTNFVCALEGSLTSRYAPITSPYQAELVYASGTADWFQSRSPKPPPTPQPPIKIEIPESARRPRHRRRTPSAESPSAPELFASKQNNAQSDGILIHSLFEQIEWLDGTTPADLIARWKQFVPEATEELHREVLDSLEAASPILTKPSTNAICWREKKFETLIGNDWISGTIDRVILDADSATVIDFKTTQQTDPEAHQRQLSLYRKVVQKMTGLEPQNIRCLLFFTKSKLLLEA